MPIKQIWPTGLVAALLKRHGTVNKPRLREAYTGIFVEQPSFHSLDICEDKWNHQHEAQINIQNMTLPCEKILVNFLLSLTCFDLLHRPVWKLRSLPSGRLKGIPGIRCHRIECKLTRKWIGLLAHHEAGTLNCRRRQIFYERSWLNHWRQLVGFDVPVNSITGCFTIVETKRQLLKPLSMTLFIFLFPDCHREIV